MKPKNYFHTRYLAAEPQSTFKAVDSFVIDATAILRPSRKTRSETDNVVSTSPYTDSGRAAS